MSESADSGRLQIGFAPDPSGEQLLRVMQKFRAAVGFASPEQVGECELSQQEPQGTPKCFYEYEFVAPDWKRTERSFFTLRGYFVVRLDTPPPYLVALRAAHNIPEAYVAYGLLPDGMHLDVDDSIREELDRTQQRESAEATRIEITFAASEPRGFRVRIVSTKPTKLSPAR